MREEIIFHYSLLNKMLQISYLLLLRLAKAFKKLIFMFYHCFRAATDVCWVVKMISSLLSIKISVHVIDDGSNEIRGRWGRKGCGRG